LPTRPSLLFEANAGKCMQVYIVVLCLVSGVLFRVVHTYERNRRMAVFLELLVVTVGFAAILRQLLH
jgi:hypothetical protein